MQDRPTVRFALVRHLADDGRRWLAFRRPVTAWIAEGIHDVAEAVHRAEQAQRAGHWVVGAISYDAGPAFDPAIASRRHPRFPLATFAAFARAEPSRGPAGAPYRIGAIHSAPDRARHRRDLHTIKTHIAAGSTYQVNHTIRLRAAFGGDPLGLFEALCRAQPADHVAYLDLGDQAVASASPELFLRRRRGMITTRPMKGTRPRHPDPDVDHQLADELAVSPKDRAENTMIVDMTRNDLGRVADIGSIEVPVLHSIESYPTVHQLTSTVTARADVSLWELLAATFPAASITGAPKVRTTQLIRDLESDPRGIYTGSIGVLDPDGGLEFNVAIRTAHIDRAAAIVEYGVGGGIVWDSDIDDEWTEAHTKARILTRAARPFRLLETMAWEPTGGPLLLDRHLDRLERSAAHFGHDLDREAIVRALDALSADRPLVVRLLVSPDGAFEIETSPRPPLDPVPWSVPLDRQPVPADDEMLRHKTTERQRYEAARRRWPGHPDVLLQNDRGELTESTIANVVLDIDGQLLTPPASSGLIPGTFRAELLANGIISEAVLTPADLHRARSCHLINSVRGWLPFVPAHHDAPVVTATR